MELRARIQELPNEVNCMNDLRDFKDVESVRNVPSQVPSQPALFPSYRDPWRLLSRSNQPPEILNSQGVSGNVFAHPRASSSSPCPGAFNPWISNVTDQGQIPDTVLTPRFQSAGNSFDPEEERFSKKYRTDQQRLQISELHFDKFPTPTTFACWKIRFKTEVCTCSHFSTEPLLWIKEVESVDDVKSSRSIRGTQGPDFELLDARNASAQNKIIQNTRFKKKVSVKEMKSSQRRPFPSRKTDRLLDLRVFPVTGANGSVENCADLFSVVLRNDDIREFDSKWDEISLSMTQIPSDGILESFTI